MNAQTTLLAMCLLGAGTAFAQTSAPAAGSATTTTYNADSSVATTPTTNGDTRNAADGSTARPMNGQTTNGTYSAGNTNSVTPMNAAYSTSSAPTETKDNDKPYKAITFGIYVGGNSTRLRGESAPTSSDKSGRLGYQAGVFLRSGGRLYGQIGAEYFASSSNYFRAGDGSTLKDINAQIDTKYLQVPVYIGYKLLQSDRGISAIRLQVGAEYANRLSNSTNVTINNAEFKSGSFNALGNLGFDFGPVFIDLVYHYGLSNTINGFNDSQRRIASASFGFKF